MNWELMFEHAILKWQFFEDNCEKHRDDETDDFIEESLVDELREKHPVIADYDYECSFCHKFHDYKYNGLKEIKKAEACEGCPLNDNGNNCQDKGSLWTTWDKRHTPESAEALKDLIISLESKYVK